VLAERLAALFAIPRILENAATAAKSAGVPDAAARLADMVVGLMSNGNGKSDPDTTNQRAAA
jgi:UDP-N-acetylglucosamine:LPS N-acetylglucosamine transferase